MNKIAVISMVKNESDIIEHFVRHNLSFADIVIIMDHDSCDGTSEILNSLQKEDNRLVVYKYDSMGHDQSEVMTALMKEAALRRGADIVIPLDADEFLLVNSGGDIREHIISLPREMVYGVPFMWYELDDINLLSKKFVLNCPCKLLDKDGMVKVLISAGNWDWQNMMLRQGNHYVMRQSVHGWEQIKLTKQNTMYLAHFAKRSREQQLSKYVVGWIHNVAKYSRYTPFARTWGNVFRAMIDGDYRDEDDSPVFSHYDKLQASTHLIKYNQLANVDSFRNLQITAEKMAQRVALTECMLAGNKADIILLCCDDLQQCMVSLASVRTQKYAVDKIFIVEEGDKNRQIIKEYYDDMKIIYISDIYQVKKCSQASYIQIMLAGDEIQADKIATAMTSSYRNHNIGLVYTNGIIEDNSTRDLFTDDELDSCIISGNKMLTLLKDDRKLPSGGIAGFLFKRCVIDDVNWLKDYQLERKVLYWIAVCNILSMDLEIVIIKDKMVKSAESKVKYSISYEMQIDAI